MKRTLTAAVGLAALMAISTGAALADGHDATVYVVHAVPGVDVDVWINGDPAIEGFAPETVTGAIALPAGDYEIEVYPAGTDPEGNDPAISLEASLGAGDNVTLVAHLLTDGTIAPQLAVFVNDVSAIASGETRIEARHTAGAPPVTLSTGGTELGDLSLGETFAADLPAGDLPLTIALADDAAAVLLDATLSLAEGTYTIAHAYLDGENFSTLNIAIDGLGVVTHMDEMEQPTQVDAGSGGLVDQGLPIWLAGLMVLGAAGVAVPAVAAARRR